MVRINNNYSIFVTSAGLDGPVVNMFVDNIKIITSKNSNIIAQIKSELAAAFSIIDIGSISFYLKLKVEYDHGKQTIKLLQLAYINKILSRFYLNKANPIATPIKENVIFQTKTKGQASIAKQKRYQEIIDFIIFLIVETRPDIAFTASMASHFAKNLCHQHIKVVRTILKYLKKTRD